MNPTDQQAAAPMAPIDVAAQWAQRKCRVFPVHSLTSDGECSCKRVRCATPGKHPRHRNWDKIASFSTSQITKWWKQWPDAQVGIVADKPDTFVIVDPQQPLPKIDDQEIMSMPSDKFFQGAQRMLLSPDGWKFSETDVPYYVDESTRLVYSYREQRGPTTSIADVAAANLALQQNMSVLDPRTSLIYIVSMAKWIEAKRNGSLTPAGDVVINVNDILDLKGLAKFKRGGYHLEQKLDIANRFQQLKFFNVNGPNPDPRGKNPTIRGPMLTVAVEDDITLSLDDRTATTKHKPQAPYAFHVKPGSAVWEFFDGPFSLCDFFVSLARLDTSQGVGRIAYQIGLYLVFQYRIRESYQNFDQALRVQTILEGARVRIESEARRYSRFREQFDAAIDRLKRDGVLDDWQYVEGDEESLPDRGWYRKWLNNRVKMTVPALTIQRAKIRAANRRDHLADTKTRAGQ